jgi:DNA-binding transcriptional MerR regulator
MSSQAPAPQDAEERDLLTLEELTERAATSVRNVRFYTSKGLLPAPIRRGRSGYYTADHLARLEMIRELQVHGFTLAAIEKYLARLPDDATPETIALHRTLLAPWMPDLPETVSREELDRRAGRTLSDEDLDTLGAFGIVGRTDDGQFQVATAHLSVGVSILELGMPLEAALVSHEIFQKYGRALAEELTENFRTRAWPVYKAAYAEGGVPPEQLQQIIERLKPVTIQALVAAFEGAVDELKRQTIAKRAQ